MVLVQPCTRSQAFGLCLLNLATFPSELPRWRQLPGDWLSLQRRLRINHVLVATSEEESGHILGSVEVHSPQYQQRLAGGAYSPEQLARLQPYLASLAVREGARGRGVGQSLVEAAVEAVRSSDYAGEHMLLGVTETNSAAVRLYERCGFETLSAAGCEVRLMRRRLRRAGQPPARGGAVSMAEPRGRVGFGRARRLNAGRHSRVGVASLHCLRREQASTAGGCSETPPAQW